MVVEKTKLWHHKRFDDFLRKWYNSKVHVAPAQLVLGLADIGWKVNPQAERSIMKRLSDLGLRNRRKEDNYGN